MEKYFKNRILPVVTFLQADRAVPVAKAIQEGGVDIIEVAFRSPLAEQAIKNIRQGVPDILVAAGTIVTTNQVEVAKKAGAQFGFAPGLNPEVVKAAKANDFPFIPGVSSPSEIEKALEIGCEIQKFFPALSLGGAPRLNELYKPYAHTGLKFVASGGIKQNNMNIFLNLSCVIAVAGSWIATKKMIESENLLKIKTTARKAAESQKH